MQHHKHSSPLLISESTYKRQDLDGVGQVEVRRRLVQKHERSVLGQDHRDPGTLALSARKPLELTICKLCNIGQFHHCINRTRILRRGLS